MIFDLMFLQHTDTEEVPRSPYPRTAVQFTPTQIRFKSDQRSNFLFYIFGFDGNFGCLSV